MLREEEQQVRKADTAGSGVGLEKAAGKSSGCVRRCRGAPQQGGCLSWTLSLSRALQLPPQQRQDAPHSSGAFLSCPK